MIKSAIVVGAGITGVAAAEWLRRAGLAVTLIDRIEPGSEDQTSYGNAGLLARSAVLPLSEPRILKKSVQMILDRDSPLFLKWGYIPKLLPWILPFLANGRMSRMMPIVDALETLVVDSIDQHEALAAGTAAETFIRRGDYAYVYRTRKDYEKNHLDWDMRRRAGFTVREVEREELARRDPHLSGAYNFAAVLEDHGWLTSPGRYVAALAAHFQSKGGVFQKGEVIDIADGQVTLKGGETLKADKIVLAAGVWSNGLAKTLNHKVNIESERGYHLHLKGPSHRPVHPFMVADAKFVVTPMADGLRCAGIVEFGGLKAGPSKAPIDLLKKRIRQVYSDLRWDSEETWMGHRPSTPDSLPHLGALKDCPNIIFAFGAQHIGLTLGPRLGRMAADIAIGRAPNIDMAPYSPERFR